MTLKEAKKILKKEMVISFHSTKPFVFDESRWIEHEKPSVLEAFRVLAKEGYYISISGHDYNMREKCLQKEYEQNTKAPGSGEEQPKEKKGIIYPSTSPKADFYYKHVLNEGNPALKEAASQFNDALLDEQAKKIARLKKIIHKKNMKIEEFRKESSIHLRGKIKMFVKNRDLEGKLKDKDAVLSDVAEELRLSKIREKNLTEVCQKYMKENEKLKKELADKVVDEIDARALKSAESALAYKEKVIAEKDEVIAELREKLKSINMNRHNERICKKQLAEKDEVIADLGKELAEAKKLNTAKILDINAKCMRAARESINDVFESYAAKYAKSTLDELKDKAYESFNAKAHKLGLVGSKDGKGVPDQMEEEKKLSLFRDDSVGAVTNQKDISPSLKVTVRLLGDDVIDLFKNMQHLW